MAYIPEVISAPYTSIERRRVKAKCHLDKKIAAKMRLFNLVIICIYYLHFPGVGIFAAPLSHFALVLAAWAGVHGAFGVTLPVGSFSPVILYTPLKY